MKKRLFSILAVAVFLIAASCTELDSTSNTTSRNILTGEPKFALVTDVGSIDDRSFNQGTWEGLVLFAQENDYEEDTHYKYFQPQGGETAGKAEYLAAIGQAVTWGAQIIICPGFLFELAVNDAQDLYPDVSFVILDGAPHAGDYVNNIKGNTVSIMYNEHEVGFMAGYAAVKEGFDELGFMGGMAVPAVIRYGIGYVAGAYYAAEELGLENFTFKPGYYEYVNSFAPDPSFTTKAEGWYQTGADVIFTCAGGVGSSVMTAAENKGKWMIGVDVDQSSHSTRVITSAMKDLTGSTKMALEDYYEDRILDIGGSQIYLDAKVDGVGLPTKVNNDVDPWRFSTFTKAEYEVIKGRVNTVIIAPQDYASLKAFVEGLGYSLELTENLVSPAA